MTDPTLRPIVIKRKKKASHEHHGGAWKIAYADFVTAMMAFFLLMWLLGSTTKAQLKGISEYFQTPLKVALFGGEGTGDATSVLKGGGEDLTKSVGQDSRKDSEFARRQQQPPPPTVAPPSPVPSPAVNLRAAELELEKREKAFLEDLKAKIERAIDANPMLRQYKNQILLDITTDGLRVQIVDEKNRPMFASGSARMQPYTSPILREIGRMLNDVPNRISLSGHTDAKPYVGGERGYSNWELSADRANTSRRELVTGGMQEDKIIRVVGLGSAVPFDKTDTFSPVNRRISIIVMKRKAEEAIRNEGMESTNVTGAEDARTQIIPNPINPAIKPNGVP